MALDISCPVTMAPFPPPAHLNLGASRPRSHTDGSRQSSSSASVSSTPPSSFAQSDLARKKSYSLSSSASVRSNLSTSTSRSFGQSLSEAYNKWKAADEAAQALASLESETTDCEQELATAKKMLQNLRTESRPRIAKRKPSLLQSIIGKSKNESAPHLPMQIAPDATAELVEASITVYELERRSHELTNRIEETQQLVAVLDDCYTALRGMLDNGPLLSWQFDQGNEGAIAKSEKTAAAREAAYDHSVVTTDALKRARAFIQSAHHHYNQAMDLVEGMCSPTRGTWTSILGDEQSKEQTYKEAGSWAERAQVCFNECLRVLTPHLDVLQQTEKDAFEELQTSGLLQAIQMYKLMYGGKALNFGITQQVELMLRKQLAVFSMLTDLAVGIQNCTKDCEDVQQRGRMQRDAARRQVISLWMNDGKHLTA